MRGISGPQSMNIFRCLGVDFRPFLPWGGSTGESNALCISYLLWVTNDCKTWWFKAMIDNDYPHSFCDSEVGSGLAERFWCEMVIKMLARTATYEGLLEAGAPLPDGSLTSLEVGAGPFWVATVSSPVWPRHMVLEYHSMAVKFPRTSYPREADTHTHTGALRWEQQ